MQRRIPIGYCVKDGKAEIDSKQSALVREIFESYLQGMSTLKIAKLLTERGVLNDNQKPSWNHGGVGKILENHIAVCFAHGSFICFLYDHRVGK